MSLDPINTELLKRAERSLHFLEPGLDVVEPLLTEARERVSGERSALPSREDVAALLAVVDGLGVLLRNARCELEDARSLAKSLQAANGELRGVVDHLLRSEWQESGGAR